MGTVLVAGLAPCGCRQVTIAAIQSPAVFDTEAWTGHADGVGKKKPLSIE
jgi:hypothetical protein